MQHSRSDRKIRQLRSGVQWFGKNGRIKTDIVKELYNVQGNNEEHHIVNENEHAID